MEKKKLKLSISGSTNKTINSIEQAKNQSKNTVVIERKSTRFVGKSKISRPISTNDKFKNKSSFIQRKPNYSKPLSNTSSDFEKRKLAEQRATKRIKGYLEDFVLSKKEADDLIMSARDKAYQD